MTIVQRARGSVRLERRTSNKRAGPRLLSVSTYRDIRKDTQFDCCLGKVAGSIPVGPANHSANLYHCRFFLSLFSYRKKYC
jgi:hypothetical protein